ncbi:MAG: hypothetical protein FWD87_02605 [Spirochaetaceae bacterium]|nr:hypothetical protein [Spirochaetaceae bacterium]
MQPMLYAQTFADAEAFERRGETQRALEILYRLAETTRPENNQYFLIIDKIISLETDIPKLLTSVEDKILRIVNVDQRIQLLKKMAVLMELSGNIEKAGHYYEMIYRLNSSDENFIYLIKAAAINLETGNIDKALSLASFVESRARRLVDLQKAKLLAIYIDILQDNRDSALRKMSQILDNKYTEETLFIIYKLSNWHDIRDTREKARSIIIRTHNQRVLDELNIYQKPLSPLFLFALSETSVVDSRPITYHAYIQTGLFSSLRNAENMRERIIQVGLPCKIMETPRSGEIFFRVVVPVETEREIENYNLILRNNNIESFIIFN